MITGPPLTRFPIEPNAKKEVGMRCSLSGMLERAAETCKRSRDNKHLEFSLLQLQKHINMLREAKSDEEAVEFLYQFLMLYVKD